MLWFINKITFTNTNLSILGPKGLDGTDGPPGLTGPKGNIGGPGMWFKTILYNEFSNNIKNQLFSNILI